MIAALALALLAGAEAGWPYVRDEVVVSYPDKAPRTSRQAYLEWLKQHPLWENASILTRSARPRLLAGFEETSTASYGGMLTCRLRFDGRLAGCRVLEARPDTAAVSRTLRALSRHYRIDMARLTVRDRRPEAVMLNLVADRDDRRMGVCVTAFCVTHGPLMMAPAPMPPSPPPVRERPPGVVL